MRRTRVLLNWSGGALTLAALFVWMGSRWWWYGGSIGATGVSIVAVAGRIDVIVSESAVPVHAPGWSRIERHQIPFAYWVHITRPTSAQAGSSTRVAVPIWFLAILTAAPPAALGWRDRRRRCAGRCVSCGYDLRGADHGVCPECGHDIGPGQGSGVSPAGA